MITGLDLYDYFQFINEYKKKAGRIHPAFLNLFEFKNYYFHPT